MALAIAVEPFKISIKRQRRKMTFTHLNSYLVLTLTFIIVNVILSEAKPSPKPTFDGFIVPSGSERLVYDYYQTPYTEPLTERHLSRLRRGYYYVDGGYITPVAASSIPVAASRRQDAIKSGNNDNVQYTPIVKYKRTRTKHKKLFVPNLFG